MASDPKKRKYRYSETDKVDAYLLNQITKHVKPDELGSSARELGSLARKLGSLARDLNIDEAVYGNITVPKDRIYKALDAWLLQQSNDYSVKSLVKDVKEWIEEGYIETSVWNRLQNLITPDILPSFSERSELRQRSMSSENLTTDFKPDTFGPPLDGHSTENSFSSGNTTTALEDSHILELSTRITNQKDLMNLGINGLNLPRHNVQSALYNHRNSIQDAAYAVISDWAQKHESKPKALENIITSLQKCQMIHLAIELRQLAEGAASMEQISDKRVKSLQERLKWSLTGRWEDCLRHDWLPEDQSWRFHLMQYYTDLKWVRIVNLALRKEKKELQSIFDILKVKDAGRKPTKILVEAKPGMGKTSSMAMLAMKYVNGETEDVPFDFVFLIPLRNVNRNCSLVDVITAEHEQLRHNDSSLLESILYGQTNHKVLLLLDGYDEYTPGTNSHIDKTIQSSTGKCFMILTSRPEHDSKEKKTPYVSRSVRNVMDGEVRIEGFSEDSIRKCGAKFLESENRCKEMLHQAKRSGVDKLLSVPIILLMTCVLYKENEALPKSRTNIFRTILELVIDRSSLKQFGYKASCSENFDSMLETLGMLAWEALQKDVRQLLIDKEVLEMKCPGIMKLGLLHEAETKTVTTGGQPKFVSFAHKSFQELAAAFYIEQFLQRSDDIQCALKELFPSWYTIMRYEEVIVFTVGLMKDPSSLIDYVYNMFNEFNLQHLRRISPYEETEKRLNVLGKTAMNLDFFKLLYSESKLALPASPLQNQYLNWFHHERGQRITGDKLFLHLPSQHFEFRGLNETVLCTKLNDTLRYGREKQSCSMLLQNPDLDVADDLISICCNISQQQPVTDLWLDKIVCKNMETDQAIKLSNSAQSITMLDCSLPSTLVKQLLHQLSTTKELRILQMRNIDVRSHGELILKAIKSPDFNSKLWGLVLINCSIPQNVWSELFQILHSCTYLQQLVCTNNRIGHAGRFIAEAIRQMNLLRVVRLHNSSIPEYWCGQIIQSLSNCKHLTHLGLSGNKVGYAGEYLAKTIQQWGMDPPLQSLYLANGSIPEEHCSTILQSLHSCTHLTELSMTGNHIGAAGQFLADFINQWGEQQQLEKIYLVDCGIPEDQLGLIIKSLANCKHLTHLGLSGNKIGNLGEYLAETIQQWGMVPSLQSLYLANCSIPEEHCSTILQSLHSCTHLTELSMTGNTIGAAGQFLADFINQWGCNPPLQNLLIRKCSLEEKVCGQIMKSLGKCKNLKGIDLFYNTVGENGSLLAQSIRQWGDNPPLQVLDLHGCSIPKDACCELISTLFSCKDLKRLSLAGSHLCESGLHLKRYLETITDTLETLCLDGCSIPIDVMGQIVLVLSRCKNLWHMSLPGNTMTGQFSQFIPHAPLSHCDLGETELNEEDLNHLNSLFQSQKLPNLFELCLYGNSLHDLKDNFERLLDICIKHHQRQLKIFLCRNNLTESCMKAWSNKCKETDITLDFQTDQDGYNATL